MTAIKFRLYVILSFLSLFSGYVSATTLTERANTGVSYVTGEYVAWQEGYLSGTWLLFHNTDYVTLNGTGYIRVRWEVEYWKRAGVTEDLSVVSSGTFKLVAGGGGFQYADTPAPFCNDPSGVCHNATGGTDDGYTWFTNQANHWHNEYYWLDGEVTLQTQESTGLYNVAVETIDYASILSDINDAESGNYHIGASYDPSYGKCPCSS